MSLKTLSLAGMALALALVIPAAAAANPPELYDVATGEPAPEASISAYGPIMWETWGAGTQCNVEAELNMESPTSGEANLQFYLGTCNSFGGLQGCVITKAEVTSNPNQVEVMAGGLSLSEVHVNTNYAGWACPKVVTLDFSSIDLLVEPGPIAEAEIDGPFELYFEEGIGPYGNVATGSLSLEEGNERYEVK